MDDDNGNATVDFGFYPLASIGDTVWYDDDQDGIQDSDEKGVANVKVILADLHGNTVKTTTTNAQGHYRFEKLMPGDYYVQFDLGTLPDHYIVSPKDQGSDDTKDSDADTKSGKTIITTLDPGENDPSWDMGIKQNLYRIGDLFWIDSDNDGKYDSDEQVIGNAKVELLDENGTVIAETKTTADGHYHFDVLPGEYKVRFHIPQEMIDKGYTFVDTQKEGDNTNKANADGIIEAGVKVGPGLASENYLTLDAAIQCPCANVASDSGDALSRLSLLLMLFMSLSLGIVFIRKEGLIEA